MKEIGIFNPAASIRISGLNDLCAVYYNLTAPLLYEEALRRNEASLTAQGALVAYTGQHTGRSPLDKFIVRTAETESDIWWDNNKPMSQAHFDVLYADFIQHAVNKQLFVEDLIGGADEANSIRVRVVTEYAWHALFIRNRLLPVI